MARTGPGAAEPPSFAARLRELRRTAGLTQEQLAERAGLTANGVSALERGTRRRPYPHTVRALAQALDLPAAEREALLASARPREGPVAAPTALALPAGAGALVGRDRDLATVLALLRTGRLVTLTGPGGVGKTRLAVEVAREAAPDYAGGTAFVSLAGLSQPSLVLDAVARCLGLPDAGGVGAPALVDHLHSHRPLIVLDNLEHLLDAAGDVADLLERCPSLTVLATSRAPLRLRAEVEYVVEPLAVPASTRRQALEHLRSSPAAQLLLTRARAAAADVDLTEETAGALAAICWRLGGLPLALELAAPKLRVLGAAQLLDRLDDALASGWARDLPPRQRTLQSTIDWSYRLLAPAERELFVRLSVFAGGFDLEAVEAVGGSGPGRPVLGPLEALVEQSLVRVTRGPRGVGYVLLEPVRQYAASLLAQSGDEEPVRAAHAAHYLALAERAAPQYRRAEQVAWLDRTEAERDNLRAAIVWSLSHDDGDTAGRLLWALWLAAWIQGWLHEARAQALAALQRPLSVPIRVRCLCVAASAAWGIGDWGAAREQWAAAVEEATAAGDDGRVYGVTGLGLHAMGEGRTDEATERLTAAVEDAERLGDEWLVSLCLVWLGTIRMITGDPDAAVPLFERGRALAQQRGDRLVTYAALFNLAQAAMAREDWSGARALLEEGVRLSVETGDRANLAYYLESIAVVDGEERLWQRAAVLVGAAQGLREAAGARTYNYYLPDDSLRVAAERGARDALGEPAYEAAVQAGRRMELHDVTVAAVRTLSTG